MKGNDKIAKWSDQVINHFWYCCGTASELGDDNKAVMKLKVNQYTLISIDSKVGPRMITCCIYNVFFFGLIFEVLWVTNYIVY